MAIAGSLIASIFMGVLIPIAAITMIILLGVWTYRDATSKGMNGILWTMVVLLVPSFVGLIVYLCVRYDAKKVTCSKCLQQVNGNSKFCSNCGQELVPVVEVSDEDVTFKKSQRNVLIGFFVSLGVMVVAVLLMIAFILAGVVGIVDTAVSAAGEISKAVSDETIETLSDLDALLGEEGIRIRVDGDNVYIKDENGNELIHIDGDSETVDADIAALKNVMNKYGIEYDDDMTNQELQEAMDELLDELENAEDMEDLEDLQKTIHNMVEKYSEIEE